MKVSTETIATKEVELTIEPDAEAVQKAMRKAAQQISRWRPIPGYRPGRAPYSMVERIFGRDTILNEAINEIAPDLYRQAVEEAGIEPYEQGQLDVQSQDPLVLKASVPLAPTVELGDYRALHVDPEPEPTITQEQIDEQLDQTRRRHAEYNPVERAADFGDQVLLTMEANSGEETVIQSQERTLIIEDNLPPPGFAEAIVGMRADETREFTLTYPEDYEGESLRGKEVSFKVTMKTVRETVLPELDDDLAKAAGDFETIDQLREAITTGLERTAERELRERETTAVMEALIEASTVEFPAAAVDHEIEHLLEGQKQRVQQVGFTWENYLRMVGQTEAELREQVREDAEKRLVRRLVLSEFARAEELTVENDELTQGMMRIAASYGERADEAMQQLSDQRVVMSIYSDLLTQKAVNRLRSVLTGREEESLFGDAEEAEEGSEDETAAEEVAEGEPSAAETEELEDEATVEEPTADGAEAEEGETA